MNYVAGEIKHLCVEINLDLKHLIISPGNHDVVRYPEGEDIDPSKFGATSSQTSYKHERDFRFFRNKLIGDDITKPLSFCSSFTSSGFDIHVATLNSCIIAATRWTEYGYTGEPGIKILRQLKGLNARPSYKILSLHHHLLPIAPFEEPKSKGVSLTLDSARLLREAQESGIQIALHGHQHLPKISKYASVYFSSGAWRGLKGEDIYIISSGSVGARRLPAGTPNTYTLVKFEESRVKVVMRKLLPIKEEAPPVFEIELPVQPQ